MLGFRARYGARQTARNLTFEYNLAGVMRLGTGRAQRLVADGSMSFTTTITCPHCGKDSEESVPVEACVIVLDCPRCGRELRPKEGDCCVFCSYGADPCPTSPRAQES